MKILNNSLAGGIEKKSFEEKTNILSPFGLTGGNCDKRE
jgi:hypothetical protein